MGFCKDALDICNVVRPGARGGAFIIAASPAPGLFLLLLFDINLILQMGLSVVQLLQPGRENSQI